MGFIDDWGSTAEERARPFPCEALVARLGRFSVMRQLLPLGDVVMMRRQLLNLRALAQHERAASGGETRQAQARPPNQWRRIAVKSSASARSGDGPRAFQGARS